ncbi:MAG: 1-acyl-sn-glycerol-3-phosphate acyltransferase [Cyclobacteriaceae bacterium]
MKNRSIKERFFGWLFKLFGWGWKGDIPQDLKKYVIVVAPHTSNIDFFIGYGFKHLVGFHPNFLAKKSLFNIPVIGWFLKSIGGHPVDRSRKTNLVDQVVELYEKTTAFIMTIAPEGTRSYSAEWKTGFYRIAHLAGVPIVKIAFDYPSKTVHVAEPVYTAGDMDNEIEEMKVWFRQFTGRHPENGVK